MGQKLVLAGVAFSDTTIPILYDDAELNPGSLALFDMTHSLSTPATGIPAPGSAIYNIAWQQAAALLGSGSASTLAFTFNSTYANNSEAIFERTTKGALHGMVSQTAQNGHDAQIAVPPAIKTHVNASPSREYALFVWARVTRVELQAAYMHDTDWSNYENANGNYLFNAAMSNVLGVQQYAVDATTGWVGSPNVVDSYNSGNPIAWGNTAPYKNLDSNDGKSFILYRAHLIDVAASGMSYAQLLAADTEFYNAGFAPGGKYYNDGYSNPSIVP